MKSNKYLLYVTSLVFLVTPLTSHATVMITEVMYDLSGSDTDREWVEITNTGSAAVDVSGYKFFEGNTNHGLTIVAGNPLLASGQSAIIVDDAATFRVDWPNYSGTLFDSSFSLSNTGEPLEIRNASGETEDSVSYSSDLGAAGDGNSLHRSGNSFVAGAPNPGVLGSQSGSTPSSGSPSSSSSSYSTPASSPAQAPSITARAGGDQTVFVGAGSVFEGEALGTQGSPLLNARYVWNFGDGTIAEGKSVMHTYLYPGIYIAVLSVASGEYSASDRVEVRVVLPEVSLMVEADRSLVVHNKSSREVDLGVWMFAGEGVTFTIPRGTIVLAGGSVRFAPSVLRFSGSSNASLLFPNGTVAAQAQENKNFLSTVVQKTVPTPVPPPAKAPVATLATVAPEDLAAAPTSSSFSLPLWGYLVGLLALVGVGVAGSLYVQMGGKTETKSTADEFEIVE